MKLLNIVLMAGSLMFATAVFGGEEIVMKVQVEVNDDEGNFHLSLNSDELGFKLHDMQEGETQSIVDEDGRSILITREADGFKFDVDGKTINMPMFAADHGAMWMTDGDIVDIDVQVLHEENSVMRHQVKGVTIISSQPIDAETRNSIRSLLTSSGQTGDIDFIDGNEQHAGMHKKVIVIKQ